MTRVIAPLALLTLLTAPGFVAGGPGPATPPPDLEPVQIWRRAHEAEILRAYARFLTIPNVAADLANARRNAEHIREELEARGARVELWEIPGAPPAVYGRLSAPGAARTLGVYLHYDGQPVEAEEWTNPPWQPTLYDAPIPAGGRPLPMPAPGAAVDPEWRLYARSAADDKAPFAALLAALDALEAAGLRRTSNLTFLFEGEEEAGSLHLRQHLERHRGLLDVDVWLILDGPVHQSRRPQLVFGVRGVIGLEITVYGAVRPLHSGHYGNWAPNPAFLLSRLLASMKDDDGRVRIAGFYDGADPLGAAEREALSLLPDQEQTLREELGVADPEGEERLEERLLLPSLNLRGLDSGAVGEEAANVIPNEARASLDIRLVAGNDPEALLDLVEEHIRGQGFHIVREEPDRASRLRHPRLARVERQAGYPAARTRMDLPVVGEVIAAARRAAGDDLLLLPGLGGSLPLHLFTELLGEPVVIVPIVNHDNNQHAADENLRLANLWYGIDLVAALLTMPAERAGATSP